MKSTGNLHLNRRDMARGAMLGGASLLLGTNAVAAPELSSNRGFIDARQWGAVGDGKADDAGALQRALDAAGETIGVVNPRSGSSQSNASMFHFRASITPARA